MDAISYAYLFAIGILLIGLEVLTFSFIFLFIGLGFVLVGLISYFYVFDNALFQIALAIVFALVLALLLRKAFLQKLSKPSDIKEEKAHVSGVGYIDGGMVRFDGTYWNTLADISVYKDGDKVEIVNVVDNKVVLK